MDKIARLREMIEQAKTICVFTGAGISTPSGIPDSVRKTGFTAREAREGTRRRRLSPTAFS
jgi:NAD-dependent deacetylase